MHVWDYDITTLKQGEDAELWKLTRQVLYGLDPGQKFDVHVLRTYLPKLQGSIPPEYFRFLTLILS